MDKPQQNHHSPTTMEESELNPSPRKYTVSARSKQIFCLSFALGLACYFGFITQRRILQNKYKIENQIAGIKLPPQPAPSITAVDPKTSLPVTLKPTGQWTLLNLWATWCPPCREEMPSLELLQQRYGHKLNIIAISMDDNKEALNEFIEANGPSFQVWWDQENKTAAAFGVSKYPETFLISPDGVLSQQFSGPRDWSSPPVLNYFAGLLD